MSDADWKPDPTGKHELRYHDGTAWTSHVSDNGVQAEDPFKLTDVAKGGGIRNLAKVAVTQAADTRSGNKVAAAERKVERDQVAADQRAARVAVGDLKEYLVDQVRETIFSDKINTSDLQGLLNRRAGEGWTLKSITSAAVSGRVGPGGSSGLIVVFERIVRA